MVEKSAVFILNGNLSSQFQEFVSANVLIAELPKVNAYFIASDEFKSEFNEYFSFKVNYLTLDDVLKKTYFHNPNLQDEIIKTLHETDTPKYQYYVLNMENELKDPSISIYRYIALKSEFHRKLFKSTHEYIFPQLHGMLDEDRINISFIGKKKMDGIEDYIVKSSSFKINNYTSSSISQSVVENYQIDDDFLQYIIFAQSDVLIGQPSIMAYEASFVKHAMVIDIGSEHMKTIVPYQSVYDTKCIFPCSHILVNMKNK